MRGYGSLRRQRRRSSFFENRFGFRRFPETPELVPYRAPEVIVEVFRRRLGGELGVEFGLLSEARHSEGQQRVSRSLLREPERRPGDEVSVPVYELNVALPALISVASLPAELRKVEEGREVGKFDPVEAWDSWWAAFSTIEPDRVDIGVRRLAVMTAQYASPLLVGDREAFAKVQAYNAQLKEQYSKKVHLSFLPKPLAEALKDRPLDEIISIRREREGW
jgi:hypothetical protein